MGVAQGRVAIARADGSRWDRRIRCEEMVIKVYSRAVGVHADDQVEAADWMGGCRKRPLLITIVL